MLFRPFALFAALVSLVHADMVPTSPDGSTVARIGSDLTALWTKDTTGQWNNGQFCDGVIIPTYRICEGHRGYYSNMLVCIWLDADLVVFCCQI
jgi:hypothetical protein